MAKSKIRNVFVCQNCGAQRSRWEGRCTDCDAWNTFVEETLAPKDDSGRANVRSRGWHQETELQQPTVISLDQDLDERAASAAMRRLSTGYSELDRVLGGGLVPGSFILLGGDPGVGKSTLLLQMSGGIAASGAKVLYVSGEESVSQSGLRAQRLGVRSGLVKMASESNLETIRELARTEKPAVLIVDSIQTVYMSEIASAPGSVTQVRECAAQLMALAKGSSLSVFLIGHVTKEGNIAGPKVLEHMVDAVLSFEGDGSHQFRLLRALKNRFGATHELGVFQMDSAGLREVANPSELFLEERGERHLGSAVFASIEGSRPLLCEVQALTTSTPMPMPRRTSIGFDVNRVHLLVAVLNRHLKMGLAQADIFINVVGGLKLMEPAADMAVAASLISTETGVEVPAKACFFGEIGLTGEARAVPFADLRLREADKLGFERFVLPASNRKRLEELPKSILDRCAWVRDVRDLHEHFVGSHGEA